MPTNDLMVVLKEKCVPLLVLYVTHIDEYI